MSIYKNVTLLCLFLFSYMVLYSQDDNIPFKVNNLFNLQQPETLGLSVAKGSETFTIFSPHKEDNKYNHGVVLFPFKGMIYAQWRSSSVDEDGTDTQVFYSKSEDGKEWGKPIALTEKWGKGIKTSGGWWSDGNALVAYISVWPNKKTGYKEGYTEYVTSSDGINWGKPKLILDAKGRPVLGVIEQDVHKMPNGRLITAFHVQPGTGINCNTILYR